MEGRLAEDDGKTAGDCGKTAGRLWEDDGETVGRLAEDCGTVGRLPEDYGKTTGRLPEHSETTTENVGRRPERRVPETDVVFRPISLLSGSETAFVCTEVLREDTARLRETTGRARDFGGKRLWEDYRKTTANLRETLPQDYGKTLPQHSGTGKTTGRLQEDCRNTKKKLPKTLEGDRKEGYRKRTWFFGLLVC